jgi:phosphatidate cytidylyltransferase
VLRQRVLTALVLGTIALVTIFALPTWAMAGVLAAVLLVGAWEWGGFAKWSGGARLGYAGAVALCMLMTWPLSDNAAAVTWVLTGAVLWWLAALLWLFRFPTPIASWLILLGGLWVILPTWLALTYLHGYQPMGRFLVFLIMAAVWAADAGAYFVGGRFGRVKLAPQVSPGKTWEGVIGGVLSSGIAAIVLCVLVNYASWQVVLPIVMAAVLASVVGDLTVSMFKRNAGLKDSGQIFPGHGGVMDRLDSVSAAAPVFVLGLALTQAGH